MSAAITRESVQALLNRAITGLLYAASINAPLRVEYWRGNIKGLRDLLTGDGAECAARKDALSGAYQPPACFEAAWAALPENVEDLSLAQMQQFLAAHRIEVATDPVAHRHLEAVQQLKGSEVPALDLDDEHAPAGVDVGDDASHGAAIVAEGGAA